MHVARKLTAANLIEVMEQLVAQRGAPAHIRSDNGSEFVARTLQGWLATRHIKTLSIEPAIPGRTDTSKASTDRCVTSAWTGNSMLSVAEARVVIEDYRRHLQRGAAPWWHRLPHTSPSLPRSPGSGYQSRQRLTPGA